MELSCIITADQQLERAGYVTHPAMWGDAYCAFAQQVSLAIEHNVPLIVAGDLLEESYPDSVTVQAMFQQFSRMEHARLPVYYIQGNHELVRRQPWAGLHPWPTHIHEKVVQIGNFSVAGLDYQPVTHLREAIAGLPAGIDVLVVHQAWQEFMGEHIPSDGSLKELIPNTVKVVVTGDFHVHKHFWMPAAPGSQYDMLVLSPGSATLQSISEDSEKYVYGLGQQLPQFKSIPIRNRPVEKVTIATPTQGAMVIESLMLKAKRAQEDSSLPMLIRTPMWVVYLHSAATSFIPELERAAVGVAHLFVRPIASDDAVKPIVAAGSLSFEAALSAALLQSSAVVRDLAVRIWRSSDVEEEIAEIVRELTTQAG